MAVPRVLIDDEALASIDVRLEFVEIGELRATIVVTLRPHLKSVIRVSEYNIAFTYSVVRAPYPGIAASESGLACGWSNGWQSLEGQESLMEYGSLGQDLPFPDLSDPPRPAPYDRSEPIV
jgi:hypothetical protein